jgi:hypothetical protein
MRKWYGSSGTEVESVAFCRMQNVCSKVMKISKLGAPLKMALIAGMFSAGTISAFNPSIPSTGISDNASGIDTNYFKVVWPGGSGRAPVGIYNYIAWVPPLTETPTSPPVPLTGNWLYGGGAWGEYVYRVIFFLNDFYQDTVSVDMYVAADNYAGLVVNNNSVGLILPVGNLPERSYEQLTGITVSGPFNQGLNAFDFYVVNTQDSPTGLLVQTLPKGMPKPDLIWRKTSGLNHVWYCDSTEYKDSGYMTTVIDGNWTIVGANLFNADNYMDVVWYNTSSREVRVWALNPAYAGDSISTKSDHYIAHLGSGWSIVGTGDMDADGQNDILLANGSNNLAFWKMNGVTKVSDVSISMTEPAGWSVKGVGKSTAGNTQIIWRNASTSGLKFWTKNGTTFNDSGAYPGLSYPWDIQAVVDFNNDYQTDIVWRNSSTGENRVWLGYNPFTTLDITTVPESSWHLVGPK